MAGKRDKPEEIVMKLRQVEVLQGQGVPIADAVRQISVTQQTYYRWRNEFGGLKIDQARRMKDLERENQRLKRAVAEQTGRVAITSFASNVARVRFKPRLRSAPNTLNSKRVSTRRLWALPSNPPMPAATPSSAVFGWSSWRCSWRRRRSPCRR